MKKIKIAQIGISEYSHGGEIFSALKENTSSFEIVGYALPEDERERFPSKMSIFDGYPEMTVEEILSDPEIEAVAVETEEIYLTKYALRAARAGKHLHMEKPGGLDIESFRELVGILKEKNLVFSVGYMYRFNPMIKKAFDKIKNGDLGEIYSVEAHMDCLHTEKARQWMSGLPGGMTFFLGCHLIDLIYRIQGEPCEVVPLNASTGFGGVSALDCGMVAFRYKNGVSFAKASACEVGGFRRRQLVICGEKGTIEIKPLEAYDDIGLHTVYHDCFDTTCVNFWSESNSGKFDRYAEMIENLALMVRGKENPYSYDYELGLYELILRACGCKV